MESTQESVPPVPSRKRAGDQRLHARPCAVCEKVFWPYRNSQLTCSRECYKKSDQRREAQKKSDARPERRARKNEIRRVPDDGAPPPQGVITRREWVRRRDLRLAGWTVEEYDQRLAELSGKCFLCGASPAPDGIRSASRLHADHDHVTGLRRDLLCGRCNVGVGMLRDDPVLMRKAAEYIERHRAAVQQEEATSG